MKKYFDIAIIGGGASGLAAAISAKRNAPEFDVAIFEKKECTGKKLSATGNGRCNLSNAACEFIEQIADFFESVGIAIRCDEEGRFYPYSEDAKEVTAMLTSCAIGEGVEIFLNSQISGMEADRKGGFLLFVDGKKKETVYAKKVILATGGKSYASMGTTGDGYIFARKLGHTVTKLVPGLTAIETAEELAELKGTRCKAKVSLFKDNQLIASEDGEVQFRQDGLSGICIMNLSGKIRLEDGERAVDGFTRYRVALNLVPDFNSGELLDMLTRRLEIKGLKVSEILRTLTKEKIAARILRNALAETDAHNRFEMQTALERQNVSEIQIGLEEPAENLCDNKQFILAVANGLRTLSFGIKGVKGWNEAQITVGGVSMAEVDDVTMESLKVPDLYFCGEVLDYDGPCGGFNLHNAWLTGILAGKSAAAK